MSRQAFVIFVNGRYTIADIQYYKKICRGKIRVAADGGIRFFQKARMIPDILIGDLDSCGSRLKIDESKTKILAFPRQKSATDGELAIDYCLDNGAGSIDLVMPSVGEIDHLLGNLFILVRRPRSVRAMKRRCSMRIVNRRYEVRYCADEKMFFRNCVGDRLSIIPISARIRLTCTGTEYVAKELLVRIGESRALRNRIESKRAVVQVAGRALVVRYYHQS